MLQVTNFTKIYEGAVPAVNNLSLHVQKGDLFAFIGHNGAGKTTLLKACAGIDSIQQGEILIQGLSMAEHPIPCKEIMAYIPDSPDIYEYLTGSQYLRFICDIYKVSQGDRDDRIPYYGDLLGITKDLGQLVGEYSHGMKQKLVLLSAFVHQPKLLLLDEPFVGLDPSAAFQVKKLMVKHCAQGNAIFFSTHILEVAEKLCNKVAIIKEGHLVASGTIEDIRGNASLEQIFLEMNPDE